MRKVSCSPVKRICDDSIGKKLIIAHARSCCVNRIVRIQKDVDGRNSDDSDSRNLQ